MRFAHLTVRSILSFGFWRILVKALLGINFSIGKKIGRRAEERATSLLLYSEGKVLTKGQVQRIIFMKILVQ